MIFDSHIHTEFSSDSKMKIEDAIKIAKKNNIGLIITEHLDLNYPVPTEFRCNLPKYFATYEKYRNEKTLLGIETGLSLSTLKENEKLMDSYSFDYIIGSIHSVNDIDIFKDYIKLEMDEKQFFQTYFKYMLKCVQTHNNFDSLGHIDYLYRYAPFNGAEINLNIHKEVLSEIIKTLIQKEKVMELNTKRLSKKSSRTSLIEVYKLYKDLGGKYVTLGSDSHSNDRICDNFKIATDMIESLNLKGVYFKKRQIHFF
ncbi:histidinol phosphate phosphatase [Clostridium tarantellae]|uniref:Histidinol-phosphatase n=1 Tax=Clostridium tarantellae TaxID=39493 RepID=A0A6I1MIM3_9CLOT|nr:histidinol phosphate phosphatase [Clostridium tarantellae]MPQ42248.1 histidinol phosphate phosphatase [Clostridium tarantellae]